MNALEARGVAKAYRGRTVLDLDELRLAEREFFVLVGPSGSGKSTLLRVLAGLIRPDSGEILLQGKEASRLAPHERGLGFVFQGLALWPHLSVRGNVALGLHRIVPDPAARAARITETARELEIERFLDTRPGLLSGGEKQRVALARALVRRPRLLLMDEPFSDLDARLRRTIARLVRRLHDHHGMTTLLITHDRTDAHLLADRIGVLRAGRLVACGAPDALHHDPGGTFTAGFLTDAAILDGVAHGDGTVETVLGSLALEGAAEGGVKIAVRPEELRIGEGPLKAHVIACEFAGGAWRCRLEVGGAEVAALHARPLRAGEEVALTPPAAPRRVLKEDA